MQHLADRVIEFENIKNYFFKECKIDDKDSAIHEKDAGKTIYELTEKTEG